MCTRITYNFEDTVNAFNFDMDLTLWSYRLFKDNERFGIEIMMPDGKFHCYHGINRNGNVGTLLNVHGNANGAYRGEGFVTITALTEGFIRGEISFEEAADMAHELVLKGGAGHTSVLYTDERKAVLQILLSMIIQKLKWQLPQKDLL